MRTPTICAALLFSLVSCLGDAPNDVLSMGTDRSTRGLVNFRWHSADEGLRRGANTLYVSAWDAMGRSADVLSVSASMPTHTHPGTTARVVRDGTGWRADALLFTMPGEWVITLRFATENATDDARVTASVR